MPVRVAKIRLYPGGRSAEIDFSEKVVITGHPTHSRIYVFLYQR
jgi:hypothetical protein